MVNRIQGISLAVASAGGIFLWSALFNQSILTTIQDLVRGQKPSPGPNQPDVVSAGITGTGTGQGGGGTPPRVKYSGGQQSWATSLLSAIGAPATQANIQSLVAWQTHESSWSDTQPDGALYTNNPLNMTLGPGAIGTVPNTPSVSIFPSMEVGIQDTAQRITGGLYGDVLAALRSGQGLCGRSFQGLSTWSGGGYNSVC